ncbi:MULTISPECIES: hypothetical protein [unclassified Pseudoalteromonas]|uniref:hypothetical protein n=1 Tax=unclassified Pseudoalteromonas TaxID=194690 RepID=UPI0020970C2D|nr:hypothetical protein [Pseudoalteromonas sp. XMcav2-N]MCO7191007.1 hypothetical protein [Pseudoalteromonas sp. XMcav2-N]
MNNLTLEQELINKLNATQSEHFLSEQPYEYKSIFLNSIVPDSTNPRFFPAIVISDLHASQLISKNITKQQLVNLYEANNKVLIGKSCIVNCYQYGSKEWHKANKSIESILELGENAVMSEIIQAPTIFPLEDGTYQLLTGHRRFFALIYAKGVDSAAHFKVYLSKPVLPKTQQFQENASREDLPQYGKLQAFQDAMHEIQILNTSRKRLGKKALTIKEMRNILGISAGAFDNYNVLVRYPAVSQAYSDGCTLSLRQVKNVVLQIESQYKEELQVKQLNAVHKQDINQRISDKLNNRNTPVKKPVKPHYNYKLATFNSPHIFKKFLSMNVMESDLDIDWEEIDWENTEAVNAVLKSIIEQLNKESQ